MNIQDNAYVTIEYKLTLDNGEVVDESSPGEPLPFIYGAGQIVSGLEKTLEGKTEGYSTRVTVEPEEGYGPVQPELLREMPLDRFPEGVELKEGMIFQADTPHGPVNFQVVELGKQTVKADFNHPLAGKTLHFDVRVAEVRESTEEDHSALSCGPDCGSGCSGCGSA